MSSRMLEKRGKTFVMATYVLGAGLALIVFGIIMCVRHVDAQKSIVDLIGYFAQIATVAVGALGLKGTAEGWQQNKLPSSESSVVVKTQGGAPPPNIPPSEIQP